MTFELVLIVLLVLANGLLAGGSGHVAAAVAQALEMAAEGADLLDVGGESTRPGHAAVDEAPRPA